MRLIFRLLGSVFSILNPFRIIFRMIMTLVFLMLVIAVIYLVLSGQWEEFIGKLKDDIRILISLILVI